jgi:ABC-type glycerol-3-phosphate transport system permease component
MIGYFASIPTADEAAIIDGASVSDADADLHLVALPGIIAATIFASPFHGRNFYLLVFTTRPTSWCRRSASPSLIKGDVFNWGRS